MLIITYLYALCKKTSGLYLNYSFHHRIHFEFTKYFIKCLEDQDRRAVKEQHISGLARTMEVVNLPIAKEEGVTSTMISMPLSPNSPSNVSSLLIWTALACRIIIRSTVEVCETHHLINSRSNHSNNSSLPVIKAVDTNHQSKTLLKILTLLDLAI